MWKTGRDGRTPGQADRVTYWEKEAEQMYGHMYIFEHATWVGIFATNATWNDHVLSTQGIGNCLCRKRSLWFIHSFIHSLVGFIYWNTSISRVCTLLFSVAWKNCSSGMWRHCCPPPPSLPHTLGVNRRGTMTSHCTHSSRRTTLKYREHIIAIGIHTTICSPTNSVNIEVNYMKRR